jgi:hypothetical protein
MNEKASERTELPHFSSLVNMRIDDARHRLEVLQADTVTETQREHRRLSATERLAVIILLEELHRLHLAISEQGKTLRKTIQRHNQARQKPTAARSPRPKASGHPGKRQAS